MEIRMNALNLVPVEWLMKNITESVDRVDLKGDIRNLFRAKATDPSFGSLLDSIIDDGFTTPICVQAYNDRYIQGNGHHRLAAAILLCLEAIPVYFTDSSDYMCSHITDSLSWRIDPESNRAWQKLICVDILEEEWCNEHGCSVNWCWD
jgi:hypothetical protein